MNIPNKSNTTYTFISYYLLVISTQQTNLHIYNNSKINQKPRKPFIYKPIFNESFISTNGNSEEKISTQNYYNDTLNKIGNKLHSTKNKTKLGKYKHKLNGSMNMILENPQENLYPKYA